MNTFREKLEEEHDVLSARLLEIERLMLAEDTWLEYYQLKRNGKI